MTEAEFQRLAAEGFNRVPLVLETFADLDTPLSIYLKLANEPYTYLLESVQGGERFGRYSFIGLASASRIVGARPARDGDARRIGHRGHRARRSAGVHPRVPRALQGRAGRRAAALLRRTGRLLRLRDGALHRAQAAAPAGQARCPGHAGHRAAAVRGGRDRRQPRRQALSRRVRRPAQSARVRLRPGAPARAARAAARAGRIARSTRRAVAHQPQSNFGEATFLQAVAKAKRYIFDGDVMQVQMLPAPHAAVRRRAARAVPRACAR